MFYVSSEKWRQLRQREGIEKYIELKKGDLICNLKTRISGSCRESFRNAIESTKYFNFFLYCRWTCIFFCWRIIFCCNRYKIYLSGRKWKQKTEGRERHKQQENVLEILCYMGYKEMKFQELDKTFNFGGLIIVSRWNFLKNKFKF